jgi:hypothetical protein
MVTVKSIAGRIKKQMEDDKHLGKLPPTEQRKGTGPKPEYGHQVHRKWYAHELKRIPPFISGTLGTHFTWAAHRSSGSSWAR